jgi:hypothetical protein
MFGAGIGALVLTYAGGAQAITALVFHPDAPIWADGVVAVAVVTLTAFSVLRLFAIAKHPVDLVSTVEATESARWGRRTRQSFGAVVAAEFVLIALVASLLARFDRELLIPVAVVAIVGAHFVPLGKIFQIPTYEIAGVFLVLLALGSLLISDESARLTMLGVVSPLVLWASAAAVLVLHTGRHATAAR